MRRGERFPGDQAEVVLSDAVIEWIVEHVTDAQREEFLDSVVGLLAQPWGKHPLSNRTSTDHLAGLNTVATLTGDYRIVFRSSVSSEGTGLIEVLAIGERTGNRVYDAVNALVSTGKLEDIEIQQIWDMLRLFEDTAERYGLETWDYVPAKAAEGLVTSAVSMGVLTRDEAALMSQDEIVAAMSEAWDPATGQLDPARALRAALARVAGSNAPERILASRVEPRCNALMPRAQKPCIRRKGHPGAHRSVS